MLYLTTLLISLYYLFFKSIGTCYYLDNYYGDDYLFEQSYDDKFNIELDNDYFGEYYFNDYSITDDNQYYDGHFDYNYSNEFDEYLTKYFTPIQKLIQIFF